MAGKQSSGHGHRGTGFPIFAALLIVVGVLLLLQNFRVLPPGMWRTVVKFWPVALLIIGVNIFLRDRPWLVGFIVLIIMLATVAAAWWLSYRYPGNFVMGAW